MKKLYIIFFFVIISFSAYAQGLVFDSVEFNKAPQFPIERSILPTSYSLEKYLPIAALHYGVFASGGSPKNPDISVTVPSNAAGTDFANVNMLFPNS